MKILDKLKFDEKGLIPAIIQDVENNQVLMLGYMNREAVKRTIEGEFVCFWSRSRGEYWVKGETSGHTQTVKEIYIDCDADTLLIKVEQKGGACHKGYRSCFFRKISNGPACTLTDRNIEIVAEKVFDPEAIYKL